MDISNKFVFLDLKYEDGVDNFNTGEKRPFLIRKTKKNKVYLIPITSQEKKKVSPLQYLISSPEKRTCLTSKKYPYSYANLNRKIIISFIKEKNFTNESLCRNKCVICVPDKRFGRFITLYKKYWDNSLNEHGENKLKTIELDF